MVPMFERTSDFSIDITCPGKSDHTFHLKRVENMDALVERFLAATRKKFFCRRPVFEKYREATEDDLGEIEQRVGAMLPSCLRLWLLLAGFGDLNEELSFRAEWFNAIDRGRLKGYVIFAQDDGGHFYAFSPVSGAIFFIRRSAPEYALIAGDFVAFMDAFETHGFELQKWTDSLESLPYEWTAV